MFSIEIKCGKRTFSSASKLGKILGGTFALGIKQTILIYKGVRFSTSGKNCFSFFAQRHDRSQCCRLFFTSRRNADGCNL